jgi:hypothetical protein
MSSLDDAVRVASALREQKKYPEAIDLLQRALAAAAPDDFHRLAANREGVRRGSGPSRRRQALRRRHRDPRRRGRGRGGLASPA